LPISLVEILDDRQTYRTNGLAFLCVLEPKGASNGVDLRLSKLYDFAATAARHGDQPDDLRSPGIAFILRRCGEDAAKGPDVAARRQ